MAAAEKAHVEGTVMEKVVFELLQLLQLVVKAGEQVPVLSSTLSYCRPWFVERLMQDEPGLRSEAVVEAPLIFGRFPRWLQLVSLCFAPGTF